MPIKKKPVSEKEKLQAKTIDQLKRYAKKVGAKIVTPEGKPKTKEQLVNSALMAQRLGAKKSKAVAKKPATKKTTARKSPVRKAAPRKRRLLAANSTEMTRDELMNYLITKVKLKSVRPGEEYSSGFRGQIWVGDRSPGYRRACWCRGSGDDWMLHRRIPAIAANQLEKRDHCGKDFQEVDAVTNS